MSKFWKIFILIILTSAVFGWFYKDWTERPLEIESKPNPVKEVINQILPEPEEPKIILPEPPTRKILNNDYHTFQTFNNCGPASLSMTLSYYEINVSQQVLGQALRPYQNSVGDNDDKSTTLEELAEKSKDYDLIPYHRPNGSIEIVKNLIANDIPVLTRTWTKPNEDIGHYRVIKGYDDAQKIFIQDDSLQGKNLEYSYDDFFAMWKPFSFEYLALAPKDKVEIVEAILGENISEEYAWQQALKVWEEELENNPNDVNARFNLSIALFHLGEYQKSVDEFEKVETRLPSRALWYQIEPIQAYYILKDYDRVFEITNRILNNNNRAFSELYIIRGDIYKNQGKTAQAKSEYEKAVLYNKNLEVAKERLNSL